MSLASNGWDQGSWDNSDFVLGGDKVVTGTSQDVVVWMLAAGGGVRLIPKILVGLAGYFCLDGDCGNEIDVTIRGFQVGVHAFQRIFERGVSYAQLDQVLQAQPFNYFHDGVWKIGYYDPVLRILVGTLNGVITTVITNVKPGYIVNLQKVVRNPVKSHTLTGASRTVRREKTLVKDIVHQVCGMDRYPRNFL